MHDTDISETKLYPYIQLCYNRGALCPHMYLCIGLARYNAYVSSFVLKLPSFHFHCILTSHLLQGDDYI